MNSITVCDVDEDQYEQDQEMGEYWDDMSEQRFDPGLVKKASEEEMSEFSKHGVYVKAPVKECWDVSGRAPIGCRWVAVNKGDDDNPEYRSRLVAT